jgi:hypothetical protein
MHLLKFPGFSGVLGFRIVDLHLLLVKYLLGLIAFILKACGNFSHSWRKTILRRVVFSLLLIHYVTWLFLLQKGYMTLLWGKKEEREEGGS